MQCPSCGKQTPDNSAFCLHCSTRLAMPAARVSTQRTTTTITCPKCNHSNPTNVKFCQKCGTSLTVACRRCGSQNALTTEFCGDCGVKLSEATFGIPRDEVEKWQEAFSSLGWFEELGSRTKQILPQLQPPLDTSKEQILFVTYGGASNHIQDVRVDDVNLRRTYIGTIGTNWRIIFFDADKMRLYAFPYEDLATVEKPAGGGMMKEVSYILRTKSGRSPLC
jgi:ribosomal protein L40E